MTAVVIVLLQTIVSTLLRPLVADCRPSSGPWR